MKAFKDLQFKPHPVGGGVQAILQFPSGYGISVVKTQYSYGGQQGLYEAAILFDGEICYTSPITDDVLGYLTPHEVEELIKKVQAL